MSDKGFPTLFVPATNRRPIRFDTPQSTPQSVHDLPARLPMGDLRPDTFRKTAEGFEVDYGCADFSMKMKLKGDSIYFDERYKETELLYYIGVANKFLGPRIVHLRLGPEEKADQRMGSDLSAMGNIKYAPFGDVMKTGSANYFPDGFLMSIVIPVPINATVFSRLKNFFRNLPEDGSLAVTGVMEFAHHVVNYRVGRCKDVPDDPVILDLWSLERGYLPLAMPVFEGSPDDQALTLRRVAYKLVLKVFMRDIFVVVRRLMEAGLIAGKDDDNQEEAAIVVANYTHLISARDVSFFSDDLSRRVFYPALMNSDINLLSPPLGHDEFERRLDTILTKYRNVVYDMNVEFDKAMKEAISNE